MRRAARLLLCAMACAGSVAHAQQRESALKPISELVPSPYDFGLPTWVPKPMEPAANPTTTAKVELGRHLFYDTRLSRDGSMSCASCHLQELAFTDGRAVSRGVTGDATPRNSMSLANVAYFPVLTWANPLMQHLERQALVPLIGQEPVELGLAGMDDELVRRLTAEPVYRRLFPEAFPEARGRSHSPLSSVRCRPSSERSSRCDPPTTAIATKVTPLPCRTLQSEARRCSSRSDSSAITATMA